MRVGAVFAAMLVTSTAYADADGREEHPRDKGYVGTAVALDLIAAAVPMPFTFASSGGDALTRFATAMVLAPFGPMLAAPFLHAVHHRGARAVGSFFGWGLSGVMTVAVGAFTIVGSQCQIGGCQPNEGPAAASMVFSATLVSLMVTMDAFLASGSSVPSSGKHGVAIVPTVWTAQRGGGVGVGGAF